MKLDINEKHRPIFKDFKQTFNLKMSEKKIAEILLEDFLGDYSVVKPCYYNDKDIKELKLK